MTAARDMWGVFDGLGSGVDMRRAPRKVNLSGEGHQTEEYERRAQKSR